MAACLASIFELELDQVPDFMGEINSGKWFIHLERWLAERNVGILMVTYPAKDVPAGYSMPGVDSEFLEDVGHSVVAYNGVVCHDPRRDAQRRPEDYKIEEWWVFTVLDPSKQPAKVAA